MIWLTLLGGWRGVMLTAALVAALGWGWLQTSRLSTARGTLVVMHAELDKARADALEAKQIREIEKRTALEAVRETYEQEKANAEAYHARLVDDLRAGAVRLRKELRCPPAADMPRTATGSESDHAAADVRGTDAINLAAARSIAIADACDAQVRAAHKVITSDRQ